ncbi:hypothetical protein A9Q75_05245 [Colwellia psychrerythraea]|uniref:Uncharacterized protein n=1 Tax=Colwellia psychrerythraea TaxID=28229 RepID=A0A1Y5EMG5_COLPS|nr:hypothetical protein A9Q75_05245 [Colwellia psychrerythraea]
MDASDYIALASMLVAIVALVATLYQSHLSKEHNKLSVVPHLIVHRYTVDESCKFTLENNGLGPAIIKEFKLVASGKEISGFIETAYDEALNTLGLNVAHSFYHPSKLEHISPAKKVDLYELLNENKEDLATEVAVISENLKFKIVYTSIYRDKDYEYFGNT